MVTIYATALNVKSLSTAKKEGIFVKNVMRKKILDRLNHLKSELRSEVLTSKERSSLTKVKLDSRSIDEDKVIALLARIDELKRLLL